MMTFKFQSWDEHTTKALITEITHFFNIFVSKNNITSFIFRFDRKCILFRPSKNSPVSCGSSIHVLTLEERSTSGIWICHKAHFLLNDFHTRRRVVFIIIPTHDYNKLIHYFRQNNYL